MKNKKELTDYLVCKKQNNNTSRAQSKEHSSLNILYHEIYLLVKDTKRVLGPERPWWYVELWEERKLQIEILELSLKEVRDDPTHDETALFIDAFFVKRYTSTSIFPSCYNDFKDRLKHILDGITPLQMNRPKYTNVEKLQAEERVVRAKTQYLQLGQSNNDMHVFLDKKLQKVSGEKVLESLSLQLGNQVKAEIQAVREEFTEELDTKVQSMQTTLDQLARELSANAELLIQFKTKYPEDYKAFTGLKKEDEKSEKKSVATNLARFSAVKSRYVRRSSEPIPRTSRDSSPREGSSSEEYEKIDLSS